ncbi:MAG: bifunctional 4-hydroxy-2-oxoglutarate aldolase/2-dehydro-3-deoxy-phosphogluconate aldolase [Symploca sp. SIO2D2]|nr:bifunctional 4-hydroxy-2-oxoglutarate aldolase/2-dehydro-3-deoxy-phosphogluconate aldolase [Symploca sp. SIO2D2]
MTNDKLSHLPWLSLLRQQRAIAVIRASSPLLGRQMAQAVAEGGISLIEITWNSSQAPELISQLRSDLPTCIIGTGTILNQKQLHQAIAAGAQFIFTPHVDSKLIEVAVAEEIPIIPGAFSPTEIVTAWQAGASCVKVFPIQALGGASYIKALQGPLGSIPLIPTGGVTLDNAGELITTGAIAVGLAGDLFPQTLIADGDWQAISQRAKSLRQRLSLI